MKTLLTALIIAGAFWFWYANGEAGPSEQERQLQRNAQLIKDCIARESSLNAAAAKTGGDILAVDSTTLCAEKYNLYQAEGQWHQLKTNDNGHWAPQ